MTDVAIIGGGLAGLSAAVALADAGQQVALFEARPKLGGRAWSFTDEVSGSTIDNGQHLMMGCYSSTQKLVRMVDAERGLKRIARLAIPFVDSQGARASIRIGSLPHPMGVMQAFLSYGFLRIRERLSVLRFALSLRRGRSPAPDALSAAEWLHREGQSGNAMRVLWEPLILATMNTEPDRASAALFARVLREIFLSDADAASLLFAASGLSELFHEPCARHLEARGAELYLHAPVRRLQYLGPDWRIGTAAGHAVSARDVLIAIAPWDCESLLRDSALHDRVGIDFSDFEPSSILSAYVWSNREISSEPITGLLGSSTQWLFSKGCSPDGSRLSTCTISSARALDSLDPEQIGRMIKDDIARTFGSEAAASIQRVKTIREKKATFIPAPGLESKRPAPVTRQPGLFLAGDWTATGLPATIESAVRSGFAAAQAILARESQP